jgi:ankyrin repeat protein
LLLERDTKKFANFLIHNSDKKNPSDDNGNTPLHFAVERGLTNVCKLIIENVDNKNPAALNGCTPLHLAAKKGHLEIIRVIVETGVDKNTTLYNGVTPFGMARPFKSFTFYKLLCKDKFQFCGMICFDLLMCFAMFWMIFACLFLVVGLFLLIFCHLDARHDDVSLYVLVTFVITFPLTILIRGWLWFH